MKMICDVPDEVIKSIRMGTWCGSSVAEKMIANGTPIPDNVVNEIEYYEKQIDKLETALAENIAVLDKYQEERKERDKGCVYCTTDRDGYITGFDKRGKYYITTDALGEPIFIIRGRELKQIPINFCPKCGRHLNAPYQKGGANRKNCEYRHENGNCLKVGGFCTSVDEEYCAKGSKE